MSSPQFSINQKVFAKVRGCPVWPGMICNTVLTKNEFIYLVYLYNIDICVKVTEDKLQDYHQYIQKHGSRISLHLLLAKAIQISIHTPVVNRNTNGSQFKDKPDTNTSANNVPSFNPCSTTFKQTNHFTNSPDQKLQKIELHFKKSSNELECSRTAEISTWKRSEYSPDHQLKTELKLLLCDFRIKSSLRSPCAKPIDCLNAMNKILKLPLNKLMLKKHPEVVKTILRLRKYVGDVKGWRLTLKQERIFAKYAREIRGKAELIFSVYRKKFNISKETDFIKLYSAEVSKFQKKVKHLNQFELFTLE